MRVVSGLSVLVLVLGSCAPAATAPTTAPTARATAPAPTAPSPATVSGTVAPTTAVPPYMRTELVDVRSSERFTLSSFPGQVVIVQGMAVW